VVRHLWHMPLEELIPIFGICLGLQSLGVEHGASIERLRVVKHGQVSKISHSGSDIFSGVGDVNVTRYHSLHVKVYQGGDLVELAHVDDGEENGHVVMALKHKSKPFWVSPFYCIFENHGSLTNR
jgi:para-aminobenzoate synthetase